jgi:hypothetical protein
MLQGCHDTFQQLHVLPGDAILTVRLYATPIIVRVGIASPVTRAGADGRRTFLASRFDVESPVMGKRAGHSIELPYMMGTFTTAPSGVVPADMVENEK